MEGRGFGNVPLTVDLKLSVEDAPNSGGVMIDAIRCMKLALDRKVGGVLNSISAYSMKSPPVQYTDTEAKKMVAEFIEGRRER
jgi:myo-inositol-1-phosphate synthase